MSTSVHVGTHIDAPSLYFPDGATVDQIALDRLCGSAVVVDADVGDWGEIGPSVLSNSTVPIQSGDIVVLRTGWHRHYGDEERYVLRGPGLTREGVDWLMDHDVKMVASDSPSPEHIFMRARQWRELRPDIFGDASIDPDRFPPSYAHKTFLRREVCLLEGLGGQIDAVVGQRVELIAMPLILEGLEAAPARVMALAPASQS